MLQRTVTPRTVTAVLVFGCSVWWAAAAGAAPADEAAHGRTLYLAHCARCHGAAGAGGEGPPLAVPALRRAPDDEALAALVRGGILAGGMPAFWQLNPNEVARVVRHVRSLAAVERTSVPGDPQRGREIFDREACESCHIVRGQGRGLGPELTAVGTRRAAGHLKESLVSPADVVPRQYELIEATLADGRRVEGLRLNEDSFTIQLRDNTDGLHTFDKSALSALRRLPARSWMTPVRLDQAALDDLVAYLVSLEGRP